MPDAKSVEGTPSPRPVIRKRIIRKPVEPAVVAPAAPVSPPIPTPAPAAPTPPVVHREPAPREREANQRDVAPDDTAVPRELPPRLRDGKAPPMREPQMRDREGPPAREPQYREAPQRDPGPREFGGPREGPWPREFGGTRGENGPGPRRHETDAREPGPRDHGGPREGPGGSPPRTRDRFADRPPTLIPAENLEPVAARPDRPIHRLDDLYRMPMPELFKLAEKEGVREHTGMNRAQLIVAVVRRQIERGELVHGSGTLEVLPDGYGFLRSAAHNYLASPEDIYVSPSQIRRMSLRTGYIVEGPIRLPIENQDNFALMQIALVNMRPAEEMSAVTNFEDLTPLHPDKRLRLENQPDELSMRIVDLCTPIGKGQRGLIVAPPRTGKTILLSKIANAVLKNHPDCYVFVLLIDERPEEVTEMQRLVQSPNAEVVASTFDEPPEEHIHVADIVLEKAKRMVEMKRDVIILLDSITRLARAYNTEAGPGGKLLSGGLDSNAMQKPKRFFGAARNVEEGGSLTIIATALIETGSRMDDVIFEEFKGTGNMELHLDRRLVEKRIYPAIDVNRSGTRKEDLLVHHEELQKIAILRKVLADMHPVEAMELLVNRAKKTKTNAEFLISMNLH